MLKNLITPGRKEVSIHRPYSDNFARTPWADLDTPYRDIERLFEQFLGANMLSAGDFDQTQSLYSPSIDVHETDTDFQIAVEVPGMDEDDIEISLGHDVLTISGEKKEEKEQNSKGVFRLERRYGSFSRSIPMPEHLVDAERVEAAYKKGVLTITLPKILDAQPSLRKIPIAGSRHGKKDGNGKKT